MSINQTFLIIILAFFCLGTVSGYLIMETTDYSFKVDRLTSYLQDEMSTHNQTKETLANTNQQLNLTTNNFTVLQTTYTSLQSSYATLQTAHDSLQTSYGNLFSNYNVSIANNTILQNELTNATIPNEYHLHKPTLNEVMVFLHEDNTSNRTYNATNYNCLNFAIDTKHNATKIGIQCGLVHMYFNDSSVSHAINCFVTTTNGTIYIEPQSDLQKNVSINGTYYLNVSGTSTPFTITKLLTIW